MREFPPQNTEKYAVYARKADDMQFRNASEIINKAIEKHEENGAAFVITSHGSPIFSHAAGLADAENGTPFRPDTICRAYSCTKVATSVACMQLVERGVIDTADDLSWYIPSFAKPYYIRDGKKTDSPPIKIRDLLNMTSGIPYPGDGREGGSKTDELWGRLHESIIGGSSMTTQEFAGEAGKLPLMFPAGSEWMYGASADILGAVIEKASGKKLSDYMADNIFTPLGMGDTAFYVPPEKKSRLAVLYETAGEHPKKPDYVNLCIFDYEKEPAFQSGGAGLFSTADDLSKLGAALASGGSGLLKPATVKFMLENGLSSEQRRSFCWDSTRGFGYANLMRILENRNEAGLFAPVSSFGWDGWTGTYLLCDCVNNVSLTLFLQRCGAGTTRLSRVLVNSVYSSL